MAPIPTFPPNCPAKKLAIVSRYFWPISGPVELEVANLAGAVSRSGHHVEIITAQWEKQWPERFLFQDSIVWRLAKPSSGRFNKFRFLKAVVEHIDRQQYDGVIVFGLEEESWGTVAALGDRIPVLVRATECHLQGSDRFSQKQVVAMSGAAKILVDSPATQQQIGQRYSLQSGQIAVVPPIAISNHQIHDHNQNLNLQPVSRRSDALQSSARSNLSDAHPIMQVHATQPLAVTVTTMQSDLGIFDLIKAWRLVQREIANAKLWIIGDGKTSRQIWDAIQDEDLVYNVMLPGFVDCLSEVLLATDLYIDPSQPARPCGVLRTAMAAGICVIQTATKATIEQGLEASNAGPSNLPYSHSPTEGLLVPHNNVNLLASTIVHAFRNRSLREQVGRGLQQRYDVETAEGDFLAEFLKPLAGDKVTPAFD